MNPIAKESNKEINIPADCQLGIDDNSIFPNMAMSLIIFMQPAQLTLSAWLEHIPFAFWLIGAQRPNVIVELGTHYGSSYFAFCQAIEQLRLPTRSYAVDTWKGDEHSGIYGDKVYASVQAHNTRLYSRFSALMKMTFDEALPFFEESEVDLLHIDGYHTYESVKHDFNSWLPKLSKRGVVIIHDSNERKENFGVFRFVRELRKTYPCFEFVHGHGLTIVGVGAEQSASLRRLFSSVDDDIMYRNTQEVFARLGKACLDEYTSESLRTKIETLRRERDRSIKETELLRQQVVDIKTLSTESEMQNKTLRTQLTQVTQKLALLMKEDDVKQEESLRMAKSLAKISDDSASREKEIQNIQNSCTSGLLASLCKIHDLPCVLKRRFRRLFSHNNVNLGKSFDKEWYLQVYPDIAASGLDPQEHYIKYGKAEGRYPNRETVQQQIVTNFDAEWYLKNYPDVAAAGMSPIEHYLIYGAKEGRYPSPATLLRSSAKKPV